jgi:catalase
VVRLFLNVDVDFALAIARGLGLEEVARTAWVPEATTPAQDLPPSPALSLEQQPKTSIASRKVAILATDGADGGAILAMKAALARNGAIGEVVGDRVGSLRAQDGALVPIDKSVLNTHSVLFDAVYVAGGATSVAALGARQDTLEFVRDAYRHGKTLGTSSEGVALLTAAGVPTQVAAMGVLVADDTDADSFLEDFVASMARHRHWDRQDRRAS